MNIIPGKEIAQKIREEIKESVKKLPKPPVLNVLLVGEDPASHLYVSLKKKAGEEAGMKVNLHHLPADATDGKLLSLIHDWNDDVTVDGILVQIPLPEGHDEDRITKAINPKKDVDGFHPSHLEALQRGEVSIIPPVHEGILRLINETPMMLSGAQGVILANSEIFAAPLKRLFETAGVSVDIMSPDNIDSELLQDADVIVIAVGRLAFLKPEQVKDVAVIIDVGTNKTPDGKTRGDVDAEAFANKKGWLSPVPGGVGPMTIALLLKNVLKLARN